MIQNVFKRKGEKPIGENNRQWDELIEKIIQGEVIPVIGPEFLAEDYDNADKSMNPHQVLVNMLAETKDITTEHESFSELLYDDAFPARERDDIYDMIGEAFAPEILEASKNETAIPQDAIFRPSRLLVKLLRICKFRFVLTTSFTPIVEYAMREIYGAKGVKVMNYNNNPLGNDDLKSSEDIQKPTVYYMFGKVCRQSKRYVVNDSDMLAFCRSWLSTAPNTLVNVLKGKYLLILGNNYSDWLCRFIWFSMKTELDMKPKGMMVNASESLLQFMKRLDAFAQKDPKAVIDKIESLLTEKRESQEELKYQTPDFNTDVFISYSRRDGGVAKKLYDELSAKGLRVWYDRENLGVGDKFMEEIKLAIRKTRVFIPILTHHIEEEKNLSHPYRTEWETALEVASTYGRNFILPLCEEGFDFYSASIPAKLQKHNADTYKSDNMDFSSFVDNVYNYLMAL